MSFTLRPHQTSDLQSLRRELVSARAVLLAAECGYGKGVIVTHIIESAVAKGKSVLFLVHGKDRVNDMDERVTKLGIAHGVLMSTRKRDLSHSVQVASSDTVYRMEEKPPADLVIIDECHLSMSPTFREVLGFYPAAKIIGMTATPMLGTGRALGVSAGGIFEAMVKGPSVRQLIAEKYLVGSRVFAPPEPSGLRGLRKRQGEFDAEQGAAVCDTTKVIGDIVAHWKKLSSDRKTAAFAFTQKHAHDIAEQFRMAGINFVYVGADTPDDLRKYYWRQMDDGDLVGVASVNCVSIGWDRPICKSLILASKTASFPLYRQRLGRGSRPYKGYNEFLVLDHCGNTFEHRDRGAFFEDEIDWQLDGDPAPEKSDDVKAVTCEEPVRVPTTGVPEEFTGPLSDDKKWMLPCFGCFEPGFTHCPYCGLVRDHRQKEREIKTAAGELKEIVQSEAHKRHDSRLQQHYIELVIATSTLRKSDGTPYKPGYAAMQFKSTFGRWPNREWKIAADEALENYVNHN